jgi:hypothetical protein
MPSPNVLDLSPLPARETNFDRTLKAFSERYTENQQLGKMNQIFDEYKQGGQDIESAINKYRTTPGLSPTQRTNGINDLLNVKKINAQLQKQTSREISHEQNRIDKEKSIESLRAGGADEADIELYRTAKPGAETKIMGEILEKNKRKETPKEFKKEELVDYDIGLTPKERVMRQNDRYGKQLPIATKNIESLKSTKAEGHSINLLQELDESGKVGEGIRNLNVNPFSGDLIIPKVSTAEEQLFVKTVNDFTVRAKDSYGGRVTNFELDRFMMRLPTLANSQEGRTLILQQMKAINQINEIEKSALQEVFDEYGIRNIDYPDAEKLAHDRASKQVKNIRENALKLENTSRKFEKDYIDKLKSKTPTGHTLMRTPEGKHIYIPDKNVKASEENARFIKL